MRQKIIKTIASLSIFFVFSNFANAATGDVLYQNCASGTCTGAGSNNGWIRTVETNGCYSGSCLKLVGSLNSNNGLYGAGSTSISNTSVNGKKEITISQWVKYNKDVNSISGGNMKLDRAYSGSKFYATSIAPSFGNDYYMGAMKGTMINKASWFSMVESTQNSAYPVNNGNGTYTVNGYIKGNITAGGPTAFGTTWVKVAKWLRLPTTDSGTNGAVKVWIDDQLVYELINVGAVSWYPIGTTFKSLSFYPSSEATEPFEHWTDEMIIYEGYVPPVPDPPVTGPTLSSPQPTSALSTGTTSTTMSVSTNVAATCKYSTTAGTAYSSMPNTMTGGGTTSHSVLVSGLTNGSSTTYYLRCAKASDGEATTTDFPIIVSVLSTQHSLTTTKNGTGNGTLISNPSGLNCGSVCSYDFNENSSVTITATPDSNSIFASWSGCDSINGNQCTVNMNTTKNITATFGSNIATCDADHYWACTDGPCQAQGFHFWEGACRTIVEPTDWTGENIAVNGTFTNWTNNLPDSWSSYTPTKVSEDNNSCSLYADNSSSAQVYRIIPEIKTYRYAINIHNMTDQLEIWTAAEDSAYHNVADGASRTVTGLVSYAGSGDHNVYIQVPGGTVNSASIDDVVLKEVSQTPAFRSDVDGSSEITTTDALLTLRNSLGLSMNGTAWQPTATTGDVNCDGVSNSTDALLILRHSLGLSMSGTEWCE